MIKSLRKSKAGFTMIELMVVIAIIGILAAIAIPQYSKYREKAYIASMQADCVSIRIAEEAHYIANDTYIETIDPAALGIVISTGNAFTVTVGADLNIAVGFLITVNSTKSESTVTYESTTGVMTVN